MSRSLPTTARYHDVRVVAPAVVKFHLISRQAQRIGWMFALLSRDCSAALLHIASCIARYTLEQRAAESARIRAEYPGRIPLICERSPLCSTVKRINRSKYLVPEDLTFGQFFHLVRNKLKVPPATALFFYVDNAMPSTSRLVSELYESHKNEDGFLYMTYAGENTFGGADVCSSMK